MPKLVLKLYTSVGGRSSVNNSTNTFVVDSTLELIDPLFPQAVVGYMAMLSDVFLANTYFMRVVASTLTHEGKKGHPEAFRTIELSLQGNKPMPANPASALPLDIALGAKVGGVTGRQGLYLFRNSLTEEDVEGGGRNSFIIVGPMQNVQAALTGFVAGNANFKLGIADRKTGNADSFRLASSFVVSSVVIKHHDIRRKRKAANSSGGAEGLLVEALPLVAAAAAFFLTKNPAAFTAVERAGAIASAGGIGSLIQQVIEHLTDPIMP